MKAIFALVFAVLALVGCANGPWERKYVVETDDGHTVSLPADKWEVNRQPARYGLTPETYMYGKAVHESCQTGNWGADGYCLMRLLPALMAKQKECNAGKNVANCEKNPGRTAGEWARLAKQLLDLQKKMEAAVPKIEKK